jgi:hypothetical protein
MKKVLVALALALPGLVFFGGQVRATPTSVNQAFSLNAHANVHITSGVDCPTGGSGSCLDISGGFSLGGLGVSVTFSNNAKGTHSNTDPGSTASVDITIPGTNTIPKQPVLGGPAGNPYISFVFLDENGDAIGKPVFLGRYVQGFTADVVQDLILSSSASAFLQSLDCSNKGTTVNLVGGQGGTGAKGLVLLDNNKNKVAGQPGEHEWSAAGQLNVNIDDIAPQQKGGNVNGVGGNPIIILQFIGAHTDGSKYNVGNPFNLGRCVQLN